MRRPRTPLVALLLLCGSVCCAATGGESRLVLHRLRHAASDLEIGGSLEGVPYGETRFVSYEELMRLPQVSVTVSDDTNFGKTVEISGVELEKLPGVLGAKRGASMVIALSDDKYAAHYPAAYLHAHHPLLVLRVNGKQPANWPLGVDGVPMGPYMVSHASYTPSFRVLSHEDEAQVPWSVVRMDVRRESEVYAPIEPQGEAASDPVVQQGYVIAKQSCFRCHSRLGEGGLKSNRHWGDLAEKAKNDPKYFDAYVLDPKKINPKSEMAASPEYDAATLGALRRYFASFSGSTP